MPNLKNKLKPINAKLYYSLQYIYPWATKRSRKYQIRPYVYIATNVHIDANKTCVYIRASGWATVIDGSASITDGQTCHCQCMMCELFVALSIQPECGTLNLGVVYDVALKFQNVLGMTLILVGQTNTYSPLEVI